MKKIVVTGAGSYVGESFKQFMEQWSDCYVIETVDMLNNRWHEKDFSMYDVVCHVAGIVHTKETKENAHLYYEINRDLSIEVAKKAKEEGVKQFVFLSTMSVYGKETGIITKETQPRPKSNYGKSKLEAEKGLIQLQTDSFKVTILRPPMVYGKGCKGNFRVLVKIVKKMPVFPKLNNCRSMIYIDNLCMYMKYYIDQECEGIFCPQDMEYVNTSRMVAVIAKKIGKKIYYSWMLGVIVRVLIPFIPACKKAFGNLTYEKENIDYVSLSEMNQTFEYNVENSCSEEA